MVEAADPFAVALDALFSAPGSLPASYLSRASGQKPVRVIPSADLATVGTVRPRETLRSLTFDIRMSDVPSPAVGDIITVAAVLYGVDALPVRDVENLTWTFTAPVLDRWVTIDRSGTARDRHGDEQPTTLPPITVQAARVDDGSSEETAAAQGDRQTAAWRRATFFLAWSEDTAAIAEADTITEQDGLRYSVESVAEIGNREGVEVVAVAKRP